MTQLVAFMRAHGIPLDGLDQGCCRVMVLSRDLPADLVQAVNASDRYELRVASNGFEAGMVAQEFRPHVVVVDLEQDENEAAAVCRMIKSTSDFQAARVLAAAVPGAEGWERRMLAMGFDACLPKPLSVRGLLSAVERATDLIT